MKKRWFLIFILLGTILCDLFGFPFWNTLRSYVFMPIYDLHMVKNSTLHKKNISFFIPGGIKTKEKDWYPYMLHHNASNAFSNFLGKSVSLDILYSFGHFDFWKGNSSFYDLQSPYGGAFYGGYAVFTGNSEWQYGFHSNGHINLEEIEKIPMFDQTYLVLPSVGFPPQKALFQSEVKEIVYDQEYVQRKNWVKIDAEIKTQGGTHSFKGTGFPGYFQYGKPHSSYNSPVEYPIIRLKGRIYARYFEEYDATFFLYILSQDEKTLEECDENLLSKSSITAYSP